MNLLLLCAEVNAMVPASKSSPNDPPVDASAATDAPAHEHVEADDRSGPGRPRLTPNRPPPLNVWVRGALLGIALGLSAVFSVAWWLTPYQEDGTPKRNGTHQGLGLPPCTFLVQTGVPCPACGMTTSFSLLVRGDVLNSLRANWVGTLLASVGMLFIPWGLFAVIRGRTPFVRSLESVLIFFLCSLLVLMLLRWAIVLGSMWYTGEFPNVK
jgi:hypothetical protein